MTRFLLVVFGGMVFPLLFVTACEAPTPEVVVYCSLDQVYSEDILDDFEKESGIKVRARYDIEANKTIGLVNAIMVESRARCDVFWSNEASRTIALARKGFLVADDVPNGASIPKSFKDHEGRWYGFAARARVIVYNTDRLKGEAIPRSLDDLVKVSLKGRVAIANPQFGTTGSHMAAIRKVLGPEKYEVWLKRLRNNDVHVTPGNAIVRDMVARGEVDCGLTDTDDVWAGLRNGHPIAMIYPNQEVGGMGTLVIPNTVMRIKGGPNPESGRKLMNWLLRQELEKRLAHGPSRQIPVRAGIESPEGVETAGDITTMDIQMSDITDQLEPALNAAQRILLQ